MDTEQLKIIVNTLNTLGENAKDVFVWWLVLDKAPAVLFGAAWTGIIAYAVKRGLDIIQPELSKKRITDCNTDYIATRKHDNEGGRG